ncbi:MAG: hypothetical protein ACRC4O_14680 [Giesbergeria sp.]
MDEHCDIDNADVETVLLGERALLMEELDATVSDRLRLTAERDAYREALRVIARDIVDDGSVTQQQVDAAYALARECAGVGK